MQSAVESQRYDEYLGSYHFYPNSIEFRIVSSKALEKFKNVQSFQLNQLVNGKFFFQQDRREILLLKYDMWSRYLTEVENYFIQLHDSNDTIRQRDIDFIVSLAEKTAQKYEQIIHEHKEGHFETAFADVWMDTHKLAFRFLVDEIRKLSGSYEGAFVFIVDILCEALQYTLVEIHELNEIFKSNSNCVFLVITDYGYRFNQSTGDCLVSNRLRIYKKYFEIDRVWLKNLTDHPINQGVVNCLEDVGVEIDYKRSIVN